MITLQELADMIVEALSKKFKNFDLRGKDFFSEKEAAHYMCVSLRYFRDVVVEYGIQSEYVLNKKVYRKTDLIAAIERGRLNPIMP